MFINEMSVDKMSVDKMAVDKMSYYRVLHNKGQPNQTTHNLTLSIMGLIATFVTEHSAFY